MFSSAVEMLLHIAYREAVSRRHTTLTLEHLLYVLTHDLEGERILKMDLRLGYNHRGIEKLCESKTFDQVPFAAERVCGICSMIHAHCYCMGIEELMAVEAPPRAQFLRVIWSEVHRIQSHLLWLGLFADSFGFESLFMQFWRIREKIMDISESTTGNRVIVSVNVIGGVRRDLNAEQTRWLGSGLPWRKEIRIVRADGSERWLASWSSPVLDAQGVPLARGDFLFHPVAALPADDVQGTALARDGLVEHHVVLERVGARHVIVVAVLPSPNHAAGLVFLAGDRLELHLHEAVA